MVTPGPIPIYRTSCSECGRSLAGTDPASVCSYADTFCVACTRKLHWRCPSCEGELARRPRRAAEGAAGPASVPERESPAGSSEVVRATAEDLDAAAPLFDAYRQFYGERSDLGAARRFLKDRLASGESVIFLARHDGEAVGLAQLYPSFSSTQLGPIWILNDLFVTPGARRRGVGSRLIERCERLAVETGARGAWLETAVDNPAQHLYAARGWKLDQEFLRFDWTPPRAAMSKARRKSRRGR